MSRRSQTLFTALTLCVTLAFADKPVKAQILSNGQVAGIGIAVAATGAAIGVGIYYAVKHNRSLTGCTSSVPNGVALTSESDKQTYTLTGDVAGIELGDRVRVSGKKLKQKPAGTRQFIVEKVSRDFGPCKAVAQAASGAN